MSAEVFAPNAKKPLLKVDGEWNGKMMAKWASGKSELFIDVNDLPIHKKRCKLIADQRSFESRRLWKMVTYNLKVPTKNDYDESYLLGTIYHTICNNRDTKDLKF